MAERRAITEENFIDAFHLRLSPAQESFVSHPIRISKKREQQAKTLAVLLIFDEGLSVYRLRITPEIHLPQ